MTQDCKLPHTHATEHALCNSLYNEHCNYVGKDQVLRVPGVITAVYNNMEGLACPQTWAINTR